jgi:exodeoxyribonuclease V alpha subunit
LPAHEPAFAITVHKSQGSEYGQVLLVLPPEAAGAS